MRHQMIHHGICDTVPGVLALLVHFVSNLFSPLLIGISFFHLISFRQTIMKSFSLVFTLCVDSCNFIWILELLWCDYYKFLQCAIRNHTNMRRNTCYGRRSPNVLYVCGLCPKIRANGWKSPILESRSSLLRVSIIISNWIRTQKSNKSGLDFSYL